MIVNRFKSPIIFLSKTIVLLYGAAKMLGCRTPTSTIVGVSEHPRQSSVDQEPTTHDTHSGCAYVVKRYFYDDCQN